MNIIDEADVNWREYEEATREAAKVKPAADWVQDVLDRRNNPQTMQGDYLPWSKTHDCIRFRPGELSLWVGINSHGKTQMLMQVLHCFAAQNRKCLVASFEMAPIESVSRWLRMASQCENYSEAFAKEWADWSREYLWLYNQTGQTTADRVLAVAEYAHRELGIHHYAVDSMMKVVRGEDDYNGQKNLVDRLFSKSRDTGMHTHLVHHSKKLMDESKIPGKFDAKGSGSITDQIDNLFTVWKNVEKRMDMQAGVAVEEVIPDGMLICGKQRNEPDIPESKHNLWFHQPSTQLIGAPHAPALDLMSEWK